MRASANSVGIHATPTLPRIPDAAKEKLTRESLVEAGVIAATIAMIAILATALRLGLERYTIGWM
jgi:hypothetical protein